MLIELFIIQLNALYRVWLTEPNETKVAHTKMLYHKPATDPNLIIHAPHSQVSDEHKMSLSERCPLITHLMLTTLFNFMVAMLRIVSVVAASE